MTFRRSRASIFNDYPDLIEADRRIYQTPSPLLRKYREFADKMEKSGKEETFYYTGANRYLRFRAQVIAEYEGRYLIKGSLINLSMDKEKEKTEEIVLMPIPGSGSKEFLFCAKMYCEM